ncbi:MAG: carbon storage regulator CsrA [Syntrophales bacterium]|jgi:carbon storage regulator|nr:carbon storage regulator CsrA [Syntrophales bacterium]MDY0043350.1 carbon storage regulator CsrA [Syntrophales bacterium]
MLVLARKSGESFRVGMSVKITVLEIKGAQVKIGIDAPDEVIIYREELFRLVEEQNTMAASSSAVDNTNLSELWVALQKKGET